jgi:PEP-CTERM motif
MSYAVRTLTERRARVHGVDVGQKPAGIKGFHHDASRIVLRAAHAMAALFLTAASFQAAPAHADVVFDFSGVCSAICTGTATGVLTLANSYAFGTDITAANFISFDYSSSSRSFVITLADHPLLAGGLNADGSFSNPESGVGFQSGAGVPLFEALPGEFVAATSHEPRIDDVGSQFTFTLVSRAVPEPSTWAMMFLGFAGLGYAGYRTARRTAVAGA